MYSFIYLEVPSLCDGLKDVRGIGLGPKRNGRGGSGLHRFFDLSGRPYCMCLTPDVVYSRLDPEAKGSRHCSYFP